MKIDKLTDKKPNRRPAVDLSTTVYGKIPPQASMIEEAVLGAVMLEKNAIDLVAEVLRPECFYKEDHQAIFSAMISLAQKSQPIDYLTVEEELSRLGNLEKIGGPYRLTTLTNSVVSAANIQSHSRIILEKYLQREMIRICGETIGDAYEPTTDVFDLIDEHERRLTEVNSGHQHRQMIEITSLLVNSWKRIEDLRQKDNSLTGVSTGFYDIDRVTNGWQPTDLIVLAARPSVGKTAFALNLARNAALADQPVAVGIFSLEMGSPQLIERLLSAESEIWLERIKSGKLDDAHMKILYEKGIQKLAAAKIFVDDTAALNIYELKAKARKLKTKHNIGLIIIDYLQLMSGVENNKNENREREISRISRELKKLAKELHIPIIALSQLSREIEKRKGEKMPLLSDLRESGAIEQDADIVMFLHRPEYYETSGDLGENTKGETHLSFAKHRNGEVLRGKDAIKLIAQLHIQKFKNWDPLDVAKAALTSGGGRWKPVSEANELFDKNDLP